MHLAIKYSFIQESFLRLSMAMHGNLKPQEHCCNLSAAIYAWEDSKCQARVFLAFGPAYANIEKQMLNRSNWWSQTSTICRCISSTRPGCPDKDIDIDQCKYIRGQQPGVCCMPSIPNLHACQSASSTHFGLVPLDKTHRVPSQSLRGALPSRLQNAAIRRVLKKWEGQYLSRTRQLSAALGGCHRLTLRALGSLPNTDFQSQAGSIDNLAQGPQPLLLQPMLEAALQSDALPARHPDGQHHCSRAMILGSLHDAQHVMHQQTNQRSSNC